MEKAQMCVAAGKHLNSALWTEGDEDGGLLLLAAACC
jgi:hypothetical protein